MDTFVAYRLHDPTDVTARLARVTDHYGESMPARTELLGAQLGALGLHVWASGQTVAATSFAADVSLSVVAPYPLFATILAPTEGPRDALVATARLVLADPHRLADLTPPCVLAILDRQDAYLELVVDLVGAGRLYSLHTEHGWFWSNRALATCLLAGLAPRADTLGWRFAAGVGWFMGETTPYEQVARVPGGTVVRQYSDGRRSTHRLDPASEWSGGRSAGPGAWDDGVDATVVALQSIAVSVSDAASHPPVVDLSSGRDSRVVAAAFMSAGVPVELHTSDANGEGATAQHLVALLERPVAHRVVGQAVVSTGPPVATPLLPSTLAWHAYAEGQRSASYLWHNPPQPRWPPTTLVVGGTGGDVAHGHFYPPDVLDLAALAPCQQAEAYVDRLMSRLVPLFGPTEETRGAVSAHLSGVLRDAITAGIDGPTMLDYLWLAERLRRFGGAFGERSGVVAPLLHPTFVRMAFAMTPEQRVANALHVALLRRMLPSWADVPFSGPQSRSPAMVRRVGQAVDRADVERLIETSDSWRVDLDVAAVRRLWSLSSKGRSDARQEVVLARVVWRACFDAHLEQISSRTGMARATRLAWVPISRPPVQGVRARALAFGRRSQTLRKIADTTWGQRVLATPVAQAILGRRRRG